MKNLLKIYALSLGFSITGAASAAELCSVNYQTQSDWGGGAQQRVTFTNNGPALNNWNFSWSFVGNETLMSFWNVPSLSQSGKSVTASHSGSVASGGSYSFDFIVNNPSTTLPAEFFLNGINCKTQVGGSSLSSSTTSSQSSSSVASSAAQTSSSVSSAASGASAAWVLDKADSTFSFVTVKKEHVAEVHRFTALDATIDENGWATLAVDLNSVATNIDIRDVRMRDILFETSFLPTLYYRVALDLDAIDAMPVGSTQVQNLNGKLTLHGVTADVGAEVTVVKTSTSDVSVFSKRPVLIGASTFDLTGGVESLRVVASLSSIGNTVPVYFSLELSANSNPSVTAIAVPGAPAAPATLTASFSEGLVDLDWADSSNNETGFLIRRKDASGFWTTIDGVANNVKTFEDILLELGVYDYKIIALNGSMPSNPSPIARVEATDPPDDDPVLVGKSHYESMCAGCHGSNAQGVANIPALNTRRDGAVLESMINTIVNTMPATSPGSCDRACAEAIVAFLDATYWEETGPELSCENPINYGSRQLRLLTRREYQNTINALLGTGFVAESLPGDELVGTFVNNTQKAVTLGTYDQYLMTAEKAAKWSAERNFANVVSCNNSFNQECANKFVNDFMPKAFRRPLDNSEKTIYTAMANGSKTNGDVKAGIQLALEGVLSSPAFIYRHEIGEKNPNNGSLASDAFELTSYEMATWLAYTYTGAPPDAQLWDKAVNGRLRDTNEIRLETQRLVNSAVFKQRLGEYVNAWLATDSLSNVSKDPSVFPNVNFTALIPLFQQELSLFFNDVMLNPQGKFSTLYDANYTYVNGPLAQHYGISGVSGDQFVKVPTTNRGGILANGGFMARWADAREPSPIRRAVRVRGLMLCQDVKDPPANVGNDRDQLAQIHKDELAKPTTTNRRRFELVTSMDSCQSCHQYIINPLGFGLEDFDSVGNPRTIDSMGNVVDASGVLYAPQAWDNSYANTAHQFTGVRDLSQIMAGLYEAQRCVPQTLFRYTMGIGVEDSWRQHGDYVVLDEQEANAYACEIEDLRKTMMDKSPRNMLEEMGVMDTVRFRKPWARASSM